jgi:signal peptidase I
VTERSEPATAPEADHVTPEPAGGGVHERRRRGGVLGAVREGVIVIGTALVLSLLIKTFLAQAFYIPSESMEGTLVRDDRVLVSLLEPGPLDLERGDVVVFRDPGGWLDPSVVPQRSGLSQAAVDVLTFVGVLPQDAGEHLIKRVIGMPGDQVVCCDTEGRLTVNDEPLEETYLPEGTEPSTLQFDVTVPEGRIWVMGDNRGFSQDSRYHQDLPGEGTVSTDLVVGRAVLLFWPLDRFGTLSNHSEVFGDVPSAP